MIRGEGSYYTPISVDGQVVEKHVDAIQVSRDDSRPRVAVTYTLSNPYDHPVVVPIQSGLTLLYEYQQEKETRKPELHVVPATVTRPGDDELLYVAEEVGTAYGTTAVQRQHLGTGIPNYRHPIAISITLAPGDSVELEATALIPVQVEKMILVDAMVGPELPYGIYPQLLEHPSSRGRVPPPLRIYQGAFFHDDPPYVEIPTAGPSTRGPRGLPRWLNPVRFARLQEALRQTGRVWSWAVTVGAVLLSASLVLRLVRAGLTGTIAVDVTRTVLFALLGAGTIKGWRTARIAFAALLGASGVLGLLQVALAIVTLPISPSVLLTQRAIVPMLFVAGSSILMLSAAVRAHTRAQPAGGRSHERADE
jgi:hypothetical protein